VGEFRKRFAPFRISSNVDIFGTMVALLARTSGLSIVAIAFSLWELAQYSNEHFSRRLVLSVQGIVDG
jgi:hypothetical protein